MTTDERSPKTYSQTVPASFAWVPVGHGRQQKAPLGFRSGLQSWGPRFAQIFPPGTHSPPAARHASGPELEHAANPTNNKMSSIRTFIVYLLKYGLLDPPNPLPLSCGRAPQATGRQLQRLVRPLHRRSHRPMWPHPALRTVTEVHVHECLVWQGHLAR